MVERRSRAANPAPATGPALATNNGQPVIPNGGGVLTGRAARQVSEMEQARIAERSAIRAQGADWDSYNQRRFYLSSPGDQADIIILDRSIDDLGFVYEHNMPRLDGHGKQIVNERTGKARYGAFETCPTETNLCPVCLNGKNYSTYNMHGTCLDLRGYNSDKLGHVPHVKRPLVIPANMHPVFFKILDDAMSRHGTIRGMQILLERDNYEKSAGCGRPVELDGMAYVMIPEDEIIRDFANPEILGDDGTTIVKAENFDVVPYDYIRTIPKPDPEHLRRKYGLSGGAPQSGEGEANWGNSRAHNDGQNNNSRANVPRTRSRSAMTAPPLQQPETPQQEMHRLGQADIPPSQREAPTPAAPSAPPPRVRSRATPPAAAAPASDARQVVRRATNTNVGEIDKDIPFD